MANEFVASIQAVATGQVNLTVALHASVVATLPGALSLESVITAGNTASVAATLPALTGQSNTGASLRATLPALQLESAATVQATSRVLASLPALTGAASVSTGGVINVAASLPGRMALSAYTGAQMRGTLPRPMTGSSSVITGGTVRVAAVLPNGMVASIAVTQEAYSRVAATLPVLGTTTRTAVSAQLPALFGRAVVTEDTAVSYEAYAVNLTTGAVTHYTNYPFDNILRFGQNYYGVASGGLYLIGGALDVIAEIAAHAHTFQNSFGELNFKRLPYVYVSGRSEGGVVVGVTADEGDTYEYESNWGEVPGTTNHRVNVGKGLRGVYYALDIKNVAGGSLELDAVSAHVAPTQRAV